MDLEGMVVGRLAVQYSQSHWYEKRGPLSLFADEPQARKNLERMAQSSDYDMQDDQ